MTPWVSPGDTMGRPPLAEVGSVSQRSDLARRPGARRDPPGRDAAGSFAVSASGLVRWFAGCSVGFPMVRALTFVLLACLLVARDARADGQVPPTTELPAVLSLADAIRIFRARGLDLLIAEAAVQSAEGDVDVAGAVPNPVGTAGYGRVLNYDPGGCDAVLRQLLGGRSVRFGRHRGRALGQAGPAPQGRAQRARGGQAVARRRAAHPRVPGRSRPTCRSRRPCSALAVREGGRPSRT